MVETLHVPTAWTVSDLRRRRTKRWSVYASDVADMTVAEMDFPVAEPVLRAVRDAVERQCFGYPLPEASSPLPQVASAWFASQGLDVPATRVRQISDVIKPMILAIRHLSPPGTPVAVITPTYASFLGAVAAAGRERIEVAMTRGPLGYELDLDGIESALRAGARTVLLCNPSNPTGAVYPRAALVALSELAERHGARVVSDEVHGPIRYAGAHVPYATVSPAAAAHAITLTSVSKAWNVPGLRCALVAFTNDEDAARWDALPGPAKGGISPLGIEASVAALTEGRAWLDHVLGVLADNRRLVGEVLAAHGIEHIVLPPAATYLAWLDLREFAVGDDPAGFLRERAKVATTPGESHGAAGRGFVRLNFAGPAPILADALDRVAAALTGRTAR
ncbi:MalY/PatB family protein [Pseudonocardia humida]|uniref:cysteine-S-conjugate beta-lyase n=1 Tax=Pseudonocardia humida TaxID=2800819 RepID=A0ABT1A9P1_9PSEU|nr:aminotransferase class I/II-fold pyridoxal phosphate-dependent enzyme [Pseudonocardia humida]MCO1659761.1 aminotransferase class I/II-fold pyridoxal phosphate-dependent enzyme [Pseudonocardia humida]